MVGEHPTFPEPAGPRPAPTPSGGDDLGALDYRARPSQGADAEVPVGLDRRAPNAGGRPVGPMIDRGIHGYDLPDEPQTYDRLGE